MHILCPTDRANKVHATIRNLRPTPPLHFWDWVKVQCLYSPDGFGYTDARTPDGFEYTQMSFTLVNVGYGTVDQPVNLSNGFWESVIEPYFFKSHQQCLEISDFSPKNCVKAKNSLQFCVLSRWDTVHSTNFAAAQFFYFLAPHGWPSGQFSSHYPNFSVQFSLQFELWRNRIFLGNLILPNNNCSALLS